jgi:plastocyanin
MTMSRLALALGLALAANATRAASIEVQVRDAAGNPLGDSAIYAVPASGGTEARNGRAAIEQVDREFVPYVTVIQVGTTVTFPNRDPILHHVYSFSPAKPFEIKLYTGKSPSEVVFDKSGVVTLGCNIHDWMVGYVVIVPTPHFGKTDATGNVRLRDLPAGAYEVRAWHPQQRAAAQAQSLVLDATGTARTSFEIDSPARKPRFKPPLDRLKY